MCSETHGNLGTEHENFRFPCSDLKVFHDVKKEEMTADHNERVEEMRRVMENIHLGLVMDDGGGRVGKGPSLWRVVVGVGKDLSQNHLSQTSPFLACWA